jgi:predicted transcriptional regulator
MPLEFTMTPDHDWASEARKSEESHLDISDNTTWRAIDSPYRLRLFEMIRRSEGLTINELAKLTCTNPVNLYYHIRTLEGHGLIIGSGHREGVARRAPVIYVASVREIKVRYNANSKLDVKRLEILRKTWIREAEISLEQTTACSMNHDSNLFRWEALSPSQHAEITHYLDRVSMILEESRANSNVDDQNRSLHYVGFQLSKVAEDTLPAPRIMMHEEKTLRDRATQREMDLVESKMQA